MRKTKQVDVGGVKIGGGAPVAIQSMSTFSQNGYPLPEE